MAIVYVTAVLVLGACRVPFSELVPAPEPTTEPTIEATSDTVTVAPPRVEDLGDGAAPGNKKGPGGFVPRGTMRNFYAGAGGRLWYYMNNYYWISETAPRRIWIKAVVVEQWQDLRKWPDGASAPDSEPKVTVEYWKTGWPSGRSKRLDNHKDYILLSEKYTAGAVSVEVTLTLGRLMVRDEKGRWSHPKEGYVLESRNYRDYRGIGADRVRFRPIATEAETVWGYRVPWDTHPQPLTRSNWMKLKLPKWRLLERRAPPPEPARPPAPAPVVTEEDDPPAGS